MIPPVPLYRLKRHRRAFLRGHSLTYSSLKSIRNPRQAAGDGGMKAVLSAARGATDLARAQPPASSQARFLLQRRQEAFEALRRCFADA